VIARRNARGSLYWLGLIASRHGNHFVPVRVLGQRQEMLQQRHAIPPAKPEAPRIRSDTLSDSRRIVEHPMDDLRGDLGHARRLDMIVQQVGDHPPGASGGKSVQQNPLLDRHQATVQSHIGPAGLAANRKRELMHVGTQIADSIQRSRGGVRHEGDPWRTNPFPCRHTRLELKPGGPQLDVVRLGCASDPIDTMRDTFEQPIAREPCERARSYAGLTGLLARTQTPLPLGNVEQALERTGHAAKYSIFGLLCRALYWGNLRKWPQSSYFAELLRRARETTLGASIQTTQACLVTSPWCLRHP